MTIRPSTPKSERALGRACGDPNVHIYLSSHFPFLLVLSICLAVSACDRPKLDAGNLATEEPAKAGNDIVARLEKIVIPVIEFEEVTVEEAIDFLRMRSFELEPGEPERRGVSWIVKSAGGVTGAGEANPLPKIRYRARNVGLLTALEEVARQAHLDVYLTNVGIVICQAGDPPLPARKMEGEEILKTLHQESP